MSHADMPAPLAPGRRRDDIQGLRAVAVVMVVAYHAGLPLPGGFTGVDVFFVVSGFVITGMLLREQLATGRIALGHFFLRRARRLLPALALVIVATLALSAVVLSPIGSDQEVTAAAASAASTIRANLYFLQQTGGYFQPAAQKNPFLHTWSLSVEEQFYLVFPITLAALAAMRRRITSWPVLTAVAAGLLLSLAASLALSYSYLPARWKDAGTWIGAVEPLRFAFFMPITRAWEFLAGVWLALLLQRWTPPSAVRAISALGGVALLVLAVATLRATDVFPGIGAMLPVVASVALLVGGAGSSPTFVNRLLSMRPFVWIGDRSYSWYLWHWPLIVYARTLFNSRPVAVPVAAVVALAVAALSYAYVEEPIRHRRVWPSRRAGVLIAACSIVLPLLCASAVTAAVRRGWGDRQLAQIRQDVIPPHIDISSICASATPLNDPRRAPCIFKTGGSRGTMLLIGDSNAGHFSEPFIAAAHALHYDAQLATIGGCPFMRRPAYQTDFCGNFVEGSLAAIAKRTPPYDAVVVSNATMGYLDGSAAPAFAADAGASPTAPSREAIIAGWVSSVQRTVEAIRPHSPVVVVGAIPQFYQVPQCLRPTLFASPTPGCGVWTPEFAARWRTDAITVERATVLGLGAAYLDAGGKVCPAGGGCSAFIDGMFVYRDGAHLSVAGSMLFEPQFRATLAGVVAGATPSAEGAP